RRRSPASRRASAWCRSRPTGCSRPRNRGRSCMRSTPPARGCRSPRSKPIGATTPSCSTCPSFSTSPAPSWNRQARRVVWTVRMGNMALQEQALPLGGIAPDRTGKYRSDHLLVAEMIAPGSRVLDVGCGDGELLQLLESRGIDGRGIELSREGVNRCVAKGLAVVQGDADTDLVNYPD